MVALFLFFFVLFSIHCLQVMYLLKKTESISKTTSQDQLRDSRAACCDWQQWKEKQMLKGEKEKFRVIHISTFTTPLKRPLSPLRKAADREWQWCHSSEA